MSIMHMHRMVLGQQLALDKVFCCADVQRGRVSNTIRLA